MIWGLKYWKEAPLVPQQLERCCALTLVLYKNSKLSEPEEMTFESEQRFASGPEEVFGSRGRLVQVLVWSKPAGISSRGDPSAPLSFSCRMSCVQTHNQGAHSLLGWTLHIQMIAINKSEKAADRQVLSSVQTGICCQDRGPLKRQEERI